MELKHSLAVLAALSLAMPVAAQEDNVHRELIRRQQQSDEFSQQLRQSVDNAHPLGKAGSAAAAMKPNRKPT